MGKKFSAFSKKAIDKQVTRLQAKFERLDNVNAMMDAGIQVAAGKKKLIENETALNGGTREDYRKQEPTASYMYIDKHRSEKSKKFAKPVKAHEKRKLKGRIPKGVNIN